MRPVLPLAFCALATACALPDTPPIGPWGVRTLPAGDHNWQVRWQGEGSAQVDGRPMTAAGALTLDGRRAHQVAIGDLRFTVPARPQECAPLRFLVLSDGRAAVDHLGPSAYWPGLLAEGLAREPAFI
ncbi:MAG: hypothetical protein KC620_21310, partial [Myxococcales bacterium]|nr:hypothetical protein [Myxococcales bacterium]